MKRFLIGALVALCSTTAASAQEYDYLLDNPENKDYFGVRLGIDITATPGNSDFSSYSNGTGFSLTGIYNIPIYKNLFFEPGIGMFYDTFSENIFTNDPNTVVDMPVQISRSFRNFGFRVPLYAGYHFDFTDDIQIAVFTGPQINLSLYAHDHIDKKYGYDNHSLFGQYGFKHMDLQWGLGASVTYNQIVFSATGAFGMTRVYDYGFDRIRRNTCTIALGYNF